MEEKKENLNSELNNKGRNQDLNDIEIIDLDSNASNNTNNLTQDKIETKSNKKKGLNFSKLNNSNTIILIAIVCILLFAFMLPYITRIFKGGNGGGGTIVNKPTNDPILLNTKEGTNETDGILFYNFEKVSGNVIRFNFKSNRPIMHPENNKLFINIYNDSDVLIYREIFKPKHKIEKQVVTFYDLELNPTSFNEAYKVNVEYINTDKLVANKKLICSKEEISNNVKFNSEIVYNMSDDFLLDYNVYRNIMYDGNEVLDEVKLFRNNIFTEYTSVSNTNTTDLVNDDPNVLKYTIDLRNLDLKQSDYKIFYQLGTANRQIELLESQLGWQCRNE